MFGVWFAPGWALSSLGNKRARARRTEVRLALEEFVSGPAGHRHEAHGYEVSSAILY